MDATEVAVIIASVGSLIIAVGGAFWGWVTKTEKMAEKARVAAQERATKEREVMANAYADSIKILSSAMDRNTKAQERTADEAKQRNGHLAEIMVEAKTAAIDVAIANRSIYEEGFKELKCQKVSKQTVDEQVIKHSVKE